MTDLGARVAVGLLPVLLFLGALLYLDSYKLVRLRLLLTTIGLGGVIAGASYVLNVSLLDLTGMPLHAYIRYVAPVIEELGKAAVALYLIRSNRVGFLVDAAIFGFAVGTGFALTENLYYLNLMADAHLAVWVVRGLGTAIMHGSTTVIFTLVTKTLMDRRPGGGFSTFIPGWLLAVAIHSFFNHFILSPILMTVIVLIALPPAVVFVFDRSERSLRAWLDLGFNADTEMLSLMNSGEFSDSKIGRYLFSLKDRFRGDVVADLLCYLRIRTELSIRAKGVLMMRESGFRVEPDQEVRSKLSELEYLEGRIGATGRLALHPFLRTSGKELWQVHMLRE